MLLIKSEKSKRIACFLLSVLLVFCIVLSPICEARAYAAVGVVTVVGVASLLVIGTILIGLGIEVTDLNLFDSLCRQVHEKLQAFAVVRDEVFLNIKDGVQYVSKELVLNIAKVLFEMQAFTPKSTSYVTYANSQIPVYENLVDSYWGGLNDMYRFVGNKAPALSSFTSFPLNICTDTSLKHDLGDSGFYYICRLPGNRNAFSIYKHGFEGYASDGNLFNSNFNVSLPNYITKICLPIAVKLSSNNIRLAFIVEMFYEGVLAVHLLSVTPSYVNIGGISAEIPPWTVANPPSISADTGDIALPPSTTWADNPAVSLPGVAAPSIPITVPSDLEGLKGMPQTDVMTGNPAGTVNPPADVVIDKEIDKALEEMKMPPTLIEKFPFSIPFDVFRAIKTLAAPAVAPAFIIPLKAPEYGIDYEFRMDWSKFEIPIAIVKWGTFLIFLLCLAGGTKKLIWG